MAETFEINAALVEQLIGTQFPHWADLAIRPVDPGGWDNRTFYLGDDMTVRLPSASWYAEQVNKEQQWLPRLAPHLPLPIPVPLAMGSPGAGYPRHWSVYRWIEGEAADAGHITDECEFANALAEFLGALQRIDTSGAPPGGKHNFFRGGPLATYDAETRDALGALQGKVDTKAVAEVWDLALQSTWQGPPVWVHGDVAATNLLVRDGQLSAVIDFGCCAIGDPACDLTIAWTFLGDESRVAFRQALALDTATWARARGWTLWKGMITLAQHIDTDPLKAATARYAIETTLADAPQE